MARAIDADKIDFKEVFIGESEFAKDAREAAQMLIDKQPTIDPVIRCRDCAVPHNKWTGCPKLNGLVPPDNFYCAFGVKKSGDQE